MTTGEIAMTKVPDALIDYRGFRYRRSKVPAPEREGLFYTGQAHEGMKIYVAAGDPKNHTGTTDRIFLLDRKKIYPYSITFIPPVYAYTRYASFSPLENIHFGIANDHGGRIYFDCLCRYDICRKCGNRWKFVKNNAIFCEMFDIEAYYERTWKPAEVEDVRDMEGSYQVTFPDVGGMWTPISADFEISCRSPGVEAIEPFRDSNWPGPPTDLERWKKHEEMVRQMVKLTGDGRQTVLSDTFRDVAGQMQCKALLIGLDEKGLGYGLEAVRSVSREDLRPYYAEYKKRPEKSVWGLRFVNYTFAENVYRIDRFDVDESGIITAHTSSIL